VRPHAARRALAALTFHMPAVQRGGSLMEFRHRLGRIDEVVIVA
jgi:hypothetical protein